MHLTAICMLSLLLMKLSQLSDAHVFWGWTGSLALFSLPVLGFLYIRDNLFHKRGKQYWVIWGCVFVLYPLLLRLGHVDVHSFRFAQALFNHDINGQAAYLSVSSLFLLIEGILLLNNRSTSTKTNTQWIKKLSVLKVTMAIAAVFSLFILMSNNYTEAYMDGRALSTFPLRFMACYLLLFITYASYYLYYYLHHHILYNSVLKERGLLPYFIGLLLTIVLVAPIHNFLISCLPMVSEFKMHSVGLAPFIYDDLNFGLPILVLLGSFPLIVVIEWYKQANALSELEQQRSKTELSLLRQQINPHFFFNTLNNLYAMSLTQEKETPETILQLSDLMRYVIYKGKEETVELQEEVTYIQDYIQLQLIRIYQRVDLKWEIEMDNEQTLVPPLLFIILVENAFKHGIEPATAASKLHISLKEGHGQLIFDCLNSRENAPLEASEGIGLDNLKKRLNILFPNKHDLILDDQEDSYRATLTLSL